MPPDGIFDPRWFKSFSHFIIRQEKLPCCCFTKYSWSLLHSVHIIRTRIESFDRMFHNLCLLKKFTSDGFIARDPGDSSYPYDAHQPSLGWNSKRSSFLSPQRPRLSWKCCCTGSNCKSIFSWRAWNDIRLSPRLHCYPGIYSIPVRLFWLRCYQARHRKTHVPIFREMFQVWRSQTSLFEYQLVTS